MRVFPLVGALAVVATMAACASNGSEAHSLLRRDSLVIGVTSSLPGLGIALEQGHYEGFDVDVASYIAKELGFGLDEVSFVSADEDNGERLLRNGEADLVLAAYSITPKRKTRLDFAGPYYLAHLDLAVRAGDDRIENVRDLEGRRLCSSPKSLSRERIVRTLGIEVVEVTEPNDFECMAAVRAGSVDAMAADDLVLAGMLQYDSGGVRLVNAPFTDERWGVALRQGDVAGCEAVNRAISRMYADGSAGKFLDRWFGASNLRARATVPQFEGCG